MPLPDFSYEQPLWDTHSYVIGFDEVGRGCLAGPVYVGGVCYHGLSPADQKKLLKLKIDDSKRCTEKKRNKLAPLIQKHAFSFHVESNPVSTINKKGIIYAIEEAELRIVDMFASRLPAGATLTVLTDTLPIKLLLKARKHPQIAVPKGDQKSMSIASASIIAKVARDKAMTTDFHPTFPAYFWSHNKGYATKAHREAIREHGPCPEHRTLYIRSVLGQK